MNNLLTKIKRWENYYQENKKLDEKFNSQYQKNEPEFYEKNCIELLVEIGEFINETKYFKYWSIKSPNKGKMLEELADCLNMIFYFYGLLNLDITDFTNTKIEKNRLKQINHIYNLSTNLFNNLNTQDIKNIFINLLDFAYSLGIKEEEILEKLEEKHQIIYNRLEDTNY